MWALIKWLVIQLAAVRWILKVFGSLAVFLPLAMLLKTVGLPLLGILAILFFPIMILFLLFGLPVFLVLLAGGAVVGLLFAVLSIGLVALKIAIFVVLPIWLMWKLVSWVFNWGRGNGETPDGPPKPVDPTV